MAHVGSWTQTPPPFLAPKAPSLTCVSPAGDDAGSPVDVRLLFPVGQADRQNVAIKGEAVPLSAPHPDQGDVVIIAARPVVPMQDDPLHGQLPLKLVLHACVVIAHPQQVATHINTKSGEKKETQDLDAPTKREKPHRPIEYCQLQGCGTSSRCDNAGSCSQWVSQITIYHVQDFFFFYKLPLQYSFL